MVVETVGEKVCEKVLNMVVVVGLFEPKQQEQTIVDSMKENLIAACDWKKLLLNHCFDIDCSTRQQNITIVTGRREKHHISWRPEPSLQVVLQALIQQQAELET